MNGSLAGNRQVPPTSSNKVFKQRGALIQIKRTTVHTKFESVQTNCTSVNTKTFKCSNKM